MQTLRFLTEMIVQDVSFKSMADALNIRDTARETAGRGTQQASSS